MSSAQMSCARNPRILPLTRLDIQLALGKIELPGDALADAESASMFDIVHDVHDPYFDDPELVMDELWALEDDYDDFDHVTEPAQPEEPWPDWGFWED